MYLNVEEFLTQKGMERYDIISNLLQNEMGYTLVWQGKNSEGKQEWKFKKDGIETEMNEDTISEYYIPNANKWRESMEKAHLKMIESVKKNPLILENNKKSNT